MCSVFVKADRRTKQVNSPSFAVKQRLLGRHINFRIKDANVLAANALTFRLFKAIRMFLRYILIFLIVFSNANFAQPTENRVALVLGNSAYKSAPLRNPTNDAKDMAAKLKGIGFKVFKNA